MAPILSQPIRAVIFDLDGTLVDSAGEIALALARAFREFGVAELSVSAVRRLIGRGVAALVERGLQQAGAGVAELPAVLERFEAHYAATVGTTARPYPLVREGLALLAQRGLPLAVVTNKPRAFSERLLEHLHMRAHFVALVAGDDGFRRKPAGDMLIAACIGMDRPAGATLMVGDSLHDVRAARAAGLRVWCVPYGYNEGRPAAALACDRIVATVEEAARLIGAGQARPAAC